MFTVVLWPPIEVAFFESFTGFDFCKKCLPVIHCRMQNGLSEFSQRTAHRKGLEGRHGFPSRILRNLSMEQFTSWKRFFHLRSGDFPDPCGRGGLLLVYLPVPCWSIKAFLGLCWQHWPFPVVQQQIKVYSGRCCPAGAVATGDVCG